MMESGLQNKHSVFISCKDHTVSNEQFNLLFDPEKQMLETFPKPEVKSWHSITKVKSIFPIRIPGTRY